MNTHLGPCGCLLCQSLRAVWATVLAAQFRGKRSGSAFALLGCYPAREMPNPLPVLVLLHPLKGRSGGMET